MITEQNVKKFSEQCKNIYAQIGRDVIGQKEVIEGAVIAMIAGGNVLLEGVPGVGKTRLVRTLGRVFSLPFSRIQFTPDLMPADVTGTNIIVKDDNGNSKFEFQPGPIFSNIILADEINRATPKTQSALLEAMEEGRVTVDGETYPMPEPFMVIATQNPTGYVGTYPLPEAQLDRFAFKLNMGYPSNGEEVEILRARRGQNPMEKVRQMLSTEDIVAAKEQVANVKLEDSLYTYIVALIAATRHHKSFSLGASPRASVALMRLSQAYAYLRGRDYVLPDDIAGLYRIAVAHRVILTQEAKLNHVTVNAVLDEIFRSVEVPYLGKK